MRGAMRLEVGCVNDIVLYTLDVGRLFDENVCDAYEIARAIARYIERRERLRTAAFGVSGAAYDLKDGRDLGEEYWKEWQEWLERKAGAREDLDEFDADFAKRHNAWMVVRVHDGLVSGYVLVLRSSGR